MKKRISLILLFFLISSLLFPNTTLTTPTSNENNNIICIEESELQKIIEEEVSKSIDKAVAVAIREKQAEIINLKIENTKLNFKIESLYRENESIKKQNIINLIIVSSICIGVNILINSLMH